MRDVSPFTESSTLSKYKQSNLRALKFIQLLMEPFSAGLHAESLDIDSSFALKRTKLTPTLHGLDGSPCYYYHPIKGPV